MIDHLRLGSAVEVDQHIAAENQIHPFHENHFCVVLKIQAAESDQLLYLGQHLQFLFIHRRKVFTFEIFRGGA
jgi:hypothetical protein